MFCRLNSLIAISSILPKHLLSKSVDPSEKSIRYIKICLQMPLIFYSKHVFCASTQSPSSSSQTVKLSGRNLSSLQIIARFLHLLLIFSPSLLTAPFILIPPLQKIWIKMFVWSVQRAGVVWIKLFQYLSHRGDVIGQKLAKNFVHLREYSPQHSYEQTQQIFRRLYGQNIEQYFDQFDKTPIASGSVSQVYAGKLRGEKVAIKVKHPGIQKNIEKDLSIVFGISRFLSFFSKIFEIPVNEGSLKEMLGDQIYFLKQRNNLIKFKEIFTNPNVFFPSPYPETTNQVLIMSYIEGKPISYYENNYHEQNKFIARVGASAFFEMLIQHNFIHADCHGGNIFINFKYHENEFLKYVKYYWRGMKNWVWNNMVRVMLTSQILKKLSDEHSAEEKALLKEQLHLNYDIEVSLLDVGMVIELQKKKREYFIQFLKEVIEGNPKQCAKMIHGISKYGGVLLSESQHPKYLLDLQNMFSLINKYSLENLPGIQVLSGMLTVIRQHHMKLDGQFATLLTNMLILEAIAKDLDPTMNILRCAIPYLPYK